VATLILLRHGESEWNAENRFTGWVDVGLTRHGEGQARHSGRLLRERGLLPDAVHTSLLRRALRTSTLLLEAADAPGTPVRCDWRLNERCYGALQGQDRRSVRAQYGAEQFRLWRRSYDAAPPPVEPGSRWDVSRDPRYRAAGVQVPRTESLADVVTRLLPYWNDAIVPDLRRGRTLLVVAHSNSLRALVAHVDRLSREDVLTLNIPTGMPLLYEFDDQMRPARRGGQYLEAAAAASAARSVAGLGEAADAQPSRRNGRSI
jgi:2,3-bisphosphoglycerate-dependent phosphoglycerate mutase